MSSEMDGDKSYYWGLKKQGIGFWCPTWKLYNDSEGEYQKHDEADLECAKRNLAFAIERGIADDIMLYTMTWDKNPYWELKFVGDDGLIEKVKIPKHTIRSYYEREINRFGENNE